jgi:hypothetical protein
MADIKTDISIAPERLTAAEFNEADMKFSVENVGEGVYWVECMIEVQQPLSLAPDRILTIGKTLVGIIGQGHKREKRQKLYASKNLKPGSYNLKLTFYMYDEDGVIADRKEHLKEIECVDPVSQNAKVL